MKKNILNLGCISILALTSNMYAGKIITDADFNNMVVTPNKQFGFGGWNLENIDVKITQLPDYRHNIGSFDMTTGIYSAMGYGNTFESDIRNGGTIVGRLHGKDWPVGEPSGVKIINGDTRVQNGKPQNCIMTTSYLPGAYLDAAVPKPNTCSGPFQSHKRFKIDMLDTTYLGDSAYGKPIEMVFNLAPGDTSVQKYQLFQKINNHTGKRLDGYMLELLDANKQSNPALTLSLDSSIWNIDDLANISHGLWGPIDDHFSKPGFFDDKTVYYPVSLSSGNTVLSYVGPMQGGNYQALFGNWMPSKWHPMGIYFDHDNNPNTEAKLLAFWGDPLQTGTNGWHKGFMEDWAPLTEDEINLWTTAGNGYVIEGIEDSVNLGLNYIVNIADNNAIGTTFTIRITPHFASTAEQNTPSYVKDAPAPNHPGSERGDPNKGNGSVDAYDLLSLLGLIFGFLLITSMGRRKFI